MLTFEMLKRENFGRFCLLNCFFWLPSFMRLDFHTLIFIVSAVIGHNGRERDESIDTQKMKSGFSERENGAFTALGDGSLGSERI